MFRSCLMNFIFGQRVTDFLSVPKGGNKTGLIREQIHSLDIPWWKMAYSFASLFKSLALTI